VGWHFDPAEGMQVAKEAVECNFWPLFEVENGRYKINTKPKEPGSVADWMKKQGRFRHLFKPGNEALLEGAQQWVDKEWARLLKLEEMTNPEAAKPKAEPKKEPKAE
jgi:pyruvate ferredoxin oxidoreductase beta subunit